MIEWDCKRPSDKPCPLWDKISIADEIELIDCMSADCPYLVIRNLTRAK